MLHKRSTKVYQICKLIQWPLGLYYLCGKYVAHFLPLCCATNLIFGKLPQYVPKPTFILAKKLLSKCYTTVLSSGVSCLQTTFYRLLWLVYLVHRPHITGCPSGVGQSGQPQSFLISLYRDLPKQVKSLSISHYRSLLKRKMKKCYT